MIKKVIFICAILAEMIASRKDFDETKYMSLLIEIEKLLEKYKEAWDKVSNTIKIRFDSETLCNEGYLRTKIKSYEGQHFQKFSWR